MDKRYLKLLAREYPTVDSVATQMVNLCAIRSLPKGTEYFFSDIHGEYEAFIHMLKSASGIIKKKIDIVLSRTVSDSERESLAGLIYYPETEIERMNKLQILSDEWKRLSIYRLILICKAVGAKYTRSRVRKHMPRDLEYILDELLNVTEDVNKDFYYEKIINTVLDTGIAEKFIISLCRLIQSLAIDKLHIIGDIFDRGPRADIIMDEIMSVHDVDIQWGNHDISWMGAASGNPALIANVIRIAMKYNSFDILEDGYGLNLRALAVFAAEVYKNDECEIFYPGVFDDNIYNAVDVKLTAKMHKAISVIQLKLEGRLMAAHPEWEMSDRDIFGRTDFINGVVNIGGKLHKLRDNNFPTVDISSPLTLSHGEEELMSALITSFKHSEKLHKHMRFIFTVGSMYKILNGNLMFHGCIPMEESGEYSKIKIRGVEYGGKELLDAIDKLVNSAYIKDDDRYSVDFMWYLWCGAKSPLYGKNKMSFFERYFLDDKQLHKEEYNPYYRFCESESVCRNILTLFGLDDEKGRIINGHVPVKIKDGESPVKANGKLFVIDGGISKAYQEKTGIAGYTLIYDSHSLSLAEHKPFIPGEAGNTPNVRIVEKMERRVNVADTDSGRELSEKIEDLRQLLSAYRSGLITQTRHPTPI